MNRKHEQAAMLDQLGQLFGPILKVVANPQNDKLFTLGGSIKDLGKDSHVHAGEAGQHRGKHQEVR